MVLSTHSHCSAVKWSAVKQDIETWNAKHATSLAPSTSAHTAPASSLAVSRPSDGASRVSCAPEFSPADRPIDHLQTYAFPDDQVRLASELLGAQELLDSKLSGLLWALSHPKKIDLLSSQTSAWVLI